MVLVTFGRSPNSFILGEVMQIPVRKVMPELEDLSQKALTSTAVASKVFSLSKSVSVYFYFHLLVEIVHFISELNDKLSILCV